MREAGARGLKGVIKGSGVLCFCCACKGTQVSDSLTVLEDLVVGPVLVTFSIFISSGG